MLMIVTKSDLREYIREDQRMQPWPSNPLKRIIGAGGAIVRWKVYLRKCEYHHNVSQNLYHKLAYFWYLFFLKKYESRFCSEIPINVFGKGLLIWHPERIIVNPESTVGDYCSLSSGVVIAQAHGRCPTVGHHVEFMIDSKVLGGGGQSRRLCTDWCKRFSAQTYRGGEYHVGWRACTKD